MVDIGENSDAKSDTRRGQSLNQFSPSLEILAKHQTRSLTNHCTADPANYTITESRKIKAFNTVFEIHKISLIQHCERSEQRLHFGEFLKT